jgi:hypothetical protein
MFGMLLYMRFLMTHYDKIIELQCPYNNCMSYKDTANLILYLKYKNLDVQKSVIRTCLKL